MQMRILGALAIAAFPVAAQTPAPKPDSGFGAIQQRGLAEMGVDQYTSTHVFDNLPDGGRVTLERDVDDSAGVAQIRTHLRDNAREFAKGNFLAPEHVHAQPVPGTSVMIAKRSVIRYTVTDLPRGAALDIRSSDPEAVTAIHQFLAFQRSAHHAGGMAH
jgi:hypothetical protein